MPTPLDLTPGHSLGPFTLGTMLFNALNHVRTYREAYPHAKLAWDDDNPSTGPLHLTLSTPPLHLLFSPLTQRLTRIEVSGLSPGAWVAYRGRALQSEEEEGDEDVVKVVRRALGPTYGSSVQNGGEGTGREEMLSYPGVAFGVVSIAAGSALSRIVLTPLRTPSSAPVDQAWLHPVLPPTPTAAIGDLRVAEIYLDSANLPTRTVLRFHGEDEGGLQPFELKIGETTSEDVLCELGGAIRTFWKEDDRMSIHTFSLGIGASDAAVASNPYFLSYPHLGLTLLLSSSPTASPLSIPSSSSAASSLVPAHTLLKIILHSNLPGQVNFGRTARCVFSFHRDGDGDGDGDGGAAARKLGGSEDSAEKIRGVLRRGKEGEGAASGTSSKESSPPGSLLVPAAPTPINGGGGGRKKKGGNAATSSPSPSFLSASPAGLPSAHHHKVENLLGLSTFDVHSSSSPGLIAAGQRIDEEGAGEEEKPMILDRTADGGQGASPAYLSSSSPGGGEGFTGDGGGGRVKGKTTEIHGFPGVALEVTQKGEVETVWSF